MLLLCGTKLVGIDVLVGVGDMRYEARGEEVGWDDVIVRVGVLRN